MKPITGLKPSTEIKRGPVLPMLKETAPSLTQAKTKQMPFASLGASTDSTKTSTISAKAANPKDLAKDLGVLPNAGIDTTVSALFGAKYATAKEIKRNEKRQDKIQKKLA
jgi:hypothetical protein